jgi:hypothetical protein
MKVHRKQLEEGAGKLTKPLKPCWVVECSNGFQGIIEANENDAIMARWKLENPDHRDVVSIDLFDHSHVG